MKNIGAKSSGLGENRMHPPVCSDAQTYIRPFKYCSSCYSPSSAFPCMSFAPVSAPPVDTDTLSCRQLLSRQA